MTEPPIVAKHLTKRFGVNRGTCDVNLVVEPGEVFGFLGPNGAGIRVSLRVVARSYQT